MNTKRNILKQAIIKDFLKEKKNTCINVLAIQAQHSPSLVRCLVGKRSAYTEETLVLTSGYKEDVVEKEGYQRLRNNASPPALVSSHGSNRPDGGWPAHIAFAN